MNKKFYIRTFGCQMNVLDSEKVAGLLVNEGWLPVSQPEDADFILYNTCSVREKAARRVYAHLGQLKALKRERPALILGVMGCVAQQEGQKMANSVAELDLVVGTQRWQMIPSHVESLRHDARSPIVDVEMPNDPEPVETEHVLRETPFRAFVTIMEGCDNFCSYCVVPAVRGRERSRPSAAIISEIKRLVDSDTVEVMLLGQNVNSYRDPSKSGWKFPELLSAVAGVGGLKRVRFTTSHPKDFNQELLNVMLEHPTICKQIHLPAQCGSTRILNEMNRQYTREDYLEKIIKIRTSSKRISLSSDFIVGFPGEKQADFEQTLSLLQNVRYDSIFSFMYSPRPGTMAADLPDELDNNEKVERLQLLQRLQETIQSENNHEAIGSRQEVLVEGAGREPGQVTSRNEYNQIVHFQGDRQLIGTFVQVRILSASAYTLRGELVDAFNV